MLAYPRGRNYKPPIERKISEAILGTLVVCTTLAAGPVAGAVGFFMAVGAGHMLFRKSDFNREVKRLQKSGYVALTKTENGWLVKILKKGKIRYKQIQIENLRLPKPKQWDGRWRLFVFDIPEEFRYARDAMRKKMKSMGLYNIQRSVLVYPYDCRNELALVAEYYRLEKYATYFETDFIDVNRELRRHFKI